MTPWEKLVEEAEKFLAQQAARREEAKRRHPAQGQPPKEDPA